MAEEPENLTLVYLRKIDEKLDRVSSDVGDLKLRMTAMERRFADVEGALAGVQSRIDRVEFRLDRIEKHLELIDTPYGGVRE